MWLLNRLFDAGDQPTPRFAFQGTVNWMRGLAIICSNNGFSADDLNLLYSSVKRRPENIEADTLAFECLVMAMHNASSVDKLSTLSNPYDCVRPSIVSWYYAIYYASKAMLSASTGADPQTHAKTGKLWQIEFVEKKLVQLPFNLSIRDLTPNNIKASMHSLRSGNTHDLNNEPYDFDMAWGATCSYLSGTADYEKLRCEQQVRTSSEFKNGGFADFRKKDARLLRDAKLTPSFVNFLVQAFRYRGKANYRDAIYLSYGSDYTDTIRKFNTDLGTVASAFVLMASHYTSKRVAKDSWGQFCKDLSDNARFELPFAINEI